MRLSLGLFSFFLVTLLVAGDADTLDPELDLDACIGDAGIVDAAALVPREDPSSRESSAETRRPRPVPDDLHFVLPSFRVIPATGSGRTETAGAWAGLVGRPTALAAGDFDEDGIADVIAGYALTNGGGIAIHRGNLDAIHPHSPGARQRRTAGTFIDAPFHLPSGSYELATTPEFLGAGDFDNDGHLDVVAGTRGSSTLVILRGDGHGRFHAIEELLLPAALTTMIVGDVNRRDGLADIVVGVVGTDGFGVAVYESPRGALRSDPDVVAVSQETTTLALARLDGQSFVGIAAGTGSELYFIHGRDRRLVLGESSRSKVPPAHVDRIPLPSTVTSIAWGDFVWEPFAEREMAVLTRDGTIHFLGHVTETKQGDSKTSSNPGGGWQVLGHRDTGLIQVDKTHSSTRPALIALELSGQSTKDLAVFDPNGGRMLGMQALTRSSLSESNSAIQPSAKGGRAEIFGLGDHTSAILPLRLNKDAQSDMVFLLDSASALQAAVTSPSAVITVNTAVDNLVAGDGACTLREAMSNANSNIDVSAGDCTSGAGVDSIEFSIGGGGAPATITPATPLPNISDPVTIDGATQGCASPPCIELNGSIAGAGIRGLQLVTGGIVVRGLAINRFQSHGIFGISSGNIIEGNHIGTDLTGTVARGNGAACSLGCGAGVRFEAPASGNTIGGTVAEARNIVSANSGVGVVLWTGANNNLVIGNLLGTDVSGTLALGNQSGVRVSGSTGNVIGGTVVTERNVISGNVTEGVHLNSDAADANRVSGNYIGTDSSGSFAVPNERIGVWIFQGDDNTVGGPAVGAGNVISGNGTLASYYGVLIDAGSSSPIPATGNQVLGNLIGTDASGTSAIGNVSVGVYILQSGDNIIGGTTPEARNVISGNGSDGIFISGRGVDRNQVLGNFIGTDVTGTAAIGNFWVGIEIQGSADNLIGGPDPGAGNLISGNGISGTSAINDSGVLIEQGAVSPTVGNRILGNRIGTDVSGSLDLGNGGVGVTILGANGNFIGGEMPGEGNLISGNASRGIFIRCSVLVTGDPCVDGTGNQVLGNLVGTDIGGSFAIPNAGGVLINTDSAIDNVVGGATPGARNVISGNTADGVYILSAQNVVIGNYIGTDITGAFDLGNSAAGVEIERASLNRIGGSLPGEGNVISGNGAMGILIQETDIAPATDNQILGNLIGTDARGVSPIGNGLEGVNVVGGTDNQIGGLNPGEGNVIAFNGEDGIGIFPGTIAPSVGPATGNAVLGNSIYENALLGIDLAAAQPGSDGVTPNDPGDGDTGGNELQNFPELTLADASPTDILIEGSMDSTSSTTFRVELFANAACDASGHGEGARFLGSTTVSTVGSGRGNFSVVLPGLVGDGEAITATATNPGNNTSEFSACFAATCTSVVGFAQMILAPSVDAFAWAAPADMRYIRGDLAAVSSYDVNGGGAALGATMIDMSADVPAPGDGLYYVVRPVGCGSWQTLPGAEPDRDLMLP